MIKMRLWMRGKSKMCLRQILGVISSLLTLVVTYYGILTINLKLATNRFFSWLPLVAAYNKRKIALKQIMKLDLDIATEPEKLSSIEHLRGTLKQKDIGFKELVFILRKQIPIIPEELYYEEKRQTIRFNKVTNEIEKHVISSLKYKNGDEVKPIDTENKSPFEYLNTEISFRLQEVIASMTVIGLFILFVLSIASNFI
jgi:hypothetical protein